MTDVHSFAVIPPECTDYVQINSAGGVGGFGTGMFVKSKRHDVFDNMWDDTFADDDELTAMSKSKVISLGANELTSTGGNFHLADAQVTGNCTLYVPMESEEDYRIYDSWREFTKIVGFNSTGIRDVTSPNSVSNAGQKIYNLNGMRISKSQPGLNIINGRKVVIK